MIWLFLGTWIIAAAALGMPLARRALPSEKSLAVLLSYSLLGGHALQTVALVYLWSFVPLGTGLYLVLGISAFIGISSLWLSRKSLPSLPAWGLSKLDSFLVAGFVAACAFLGHRAFTIAYSALDPEAMFLRSGVTAWLTRGLFPPTNPLELSDQLHYRFGLNLLAAAFSAASGALATVSVAVTIGLLLALMALAFTGASHNLFGSPRPGLAAALLGLLGGSMLWMLRLGQALVTGTAPSLNSKEIMNGLLWGGSTLFTVDMNVSVAAGFAAFTIALWLSWVAVDPRSAHHSLSADLVALASLVYLGLFYEVYAVALFAAMIAVGCLQCWESRKDGDGLRALAHVGRPLLLALFSLAIVVSRGGLLAGMSIAGEAGRSLGLVLNSEHLGSVVVPVNKPISGWFPLLSVDATVDTDFILFGLPLLMFVAWRMRNSYALTGLTACGVSLIAWLSIYPKEYPESAYHFGQAALVGYVALAPVALANLSRMSGTIFGRVIRWATPAIIAIPVIPGLVLASWVVFSPPHPTEAVPGSPDYMAGLYLRQSHSTSRVLVPLARPQHGEPGWEQLYLKGGPSQAIRIILAMSSHSVPLGFSPDFRTPSPTAELYYQASEDFTPKSLAALKIDWVYVLPSYLSASQRRNLQNAVGAKELELEKRFGEAGQDSERLLYRVVTNSR